MYIHKTHTVSMQSTLYICNKQFCRRAEVARCFVSVSVHSTKKRPALSFIVSFIGYRFISAYIQMLFCCFFCVTLKHLIINISLSSPAIKPRRLLGLPVTRLMPWFSAAAALIAPASAPALTETRSVANGLAIKSSSEFVLNVTMAVQQINLACVPVCTRPLLSN